MNWNERRKAERCRKSQAKCPGGHHRQCFPPREHTPWCYDCGKKIIYGRDYMQDWAISASPGWDAWLKKWNR